MTGNQSATLSRRSVLAAIGTGLTAGLVGTEATARRRDKSQYAIEQGGRCVPVQPIRGRLPADKFYDFRLPEKHVSDANGAFIGNSALYASAGTRDLQRGQTSIAFLYQGPEGLSLVVVHGSVRNADAGAVTFRISGLPDDGEWIVKDDLYRDPDTGEIATTNYDRWDVDGADHRIDWTWGTAGTDGGVFRDLGGDFEVVVRPAFNEASPLHNEYYEGTVTDWEFLSGATDPSKRVSLDLNESIRITTRGCGGDTGSTKAGQRTEQEQKTRQSRQDEQSQRNQQEQRERREGQQERQEEREERREEQREEREERQEEREEREERQEEREEREERQEEREEQREEREERREEQREEREERREEQREEREEDDDDDDDDDE